MQPGMQAGKCTKREFKVAQSLGKAGEGLPELQVTSPSSHWDWQTIWWFRRPRAQGFFHRWE